MTENNPTMEDVTSNANPDLNELAQLLEKIAQNPYDYETHVAYVSLLRRMGETSDLRQAREVFHEFFPLSEGIIFRKRSTYVDLWMQWLEDEEQATASDAHALQDLLELHERATRDYLCMSLIKS